MKFSFDKAACQNFRRASRKEWLLTNGRGDYASSSILCCNTRKYHGLLTVNTLQGRHVLLSTFEESVRGGGKEFFLSTRRHPQQLYPHGHKHLENFQLDQWPEFTYRIGDVLLRREIILLDGVTRLVLRYSVKNPDGLPPLTLRLKPLLAYRNMHELTHANPHLRADTRTQQNGFSIAPYEGLPQLFFQTHGTHVFHPSPDWYYHIEYFQEQERGFPYDEDLFNPGVLEIPLSEKNDIYVAVGTEYCTEDLGQIWKKESRKKLDAHKSGGGLIGNLAQIGRQFCIETPLGRPAVLAGYHWFDAWGRDTLIALPGLTFLSGRTAFGLRVLKQVAGSLRNGLAPNMFAENGNHAYNTVDAALWYAFAVQSYLKSEPDGLAWVRENAWSALKAIVQGYRQGPGMDIFVDDHGLLHAGNAHTQLTWMDAQSDGKPVTPRHGCPVEINALWYNTLAFVDHLASLFGEPEWEGTNLLRDLRAAFYGRFWVARGSGYLGDVWLNGMLDQSVRPNQILAVSLPYPVLEEKHQPCVVECVRNKLLTPFGLRTLSPDDSAYEYRYEGTTSERDAAYHQGTVWPWLLGHYADALLRTAWDIDGAASSLLDTLTPLYCDHLTDAGLGTISEIFDASPPYRPNGCIAQAWSVAECLRLLTLIRKAAPVVYTEWEKQVAHRLANPVSGDTAGVCRVTMTLLSGKSQDATRI
ncbi:MAG: amylo-alpha-1,6-glucosidase [Desulfovibrio sp.]|jgi:predicted glycogen debranching enzyme|nr:amylo-alpha-1,6-glucosidase [Desulfovibrio sp.]